ncbi:unnamed protein product, partial [Didymodactylos carnosus]
VLGDILAGLIGSDDIEEFEGFWLHNMSTLFDGGDDEVIFTEERFGERSGWPGDVCDNDDEVIFIEERFRERSGWNGEEGTSKYMS